MNQDLNNLYILIQARVRSTRLPAKIFFQFCEELVIDRVIKIAKKINNGKNIFILSGNREYNKILDYIAKINNIEIFYGSEKNVFKRFLDFINNQKVKPKYICRLTSDGYLIQPSIVKKMIKDIKRYNYDYSYVKPLSHFAGEIMKTSLFFKKKNISNQAKEHVTWDFRRDTNLIVKAYNTNFCNLNHKNFLVLDSIKDFVKMKIIEKKFPNLKKLDCIKTIKKAVKYIN